VMEVLEVLEALEVPFLRLLVSPKMKDLDL
jgi:hypothetical protein